MHGSKVTAKFKMLARLRIFLCAPVFGIDFLFVSFFFFLATSTILCNDMSITFRRESVEQWRDKTNYVCGHSKD